MKFYFGISFKILTAAYRLYVIKYIFQLRVLSYRHLVDTAVTSMDPMAISHFEGIFTMGQNYATR